jgi:hypothetical protein
MIDKTLIPWARFARLWAVGRDVKASQSPKGASRLVSPAQDVDQEHNAERHSEGF